jgi:chromosomal replication initiation ATPase DnaA
MKYKLINNKMYQKAFKSNKLEMITRGVCEHFEISVWDIKSKSRETRFAIPRMISMYLGYKKLVGTKKDIGKFFNRDHSTVINALRRIEGDMFIYPDFKKEIESIEMCLNGEKKLGFKFEIPVNSPEVNQNLEVLQELKPSL